MSDSKGNIQSQFIIMAVWMAYRIRAPWIPGYFFFLDTMLDYISQSSLQLGVAMWLKTDWWTEAICATTRSGRKPYKPFSMLLLWRPWGLCDVRRLGPWIIIWRRAFCQSETSICILHEWKTGFLWCLNIYTHIFWDLLVTVAGVILTTNDSI